MRIEAEKCSAQSEIVFLGAVGEKPEVANADEAHGQSVEKESPNKFFRGQGHGLALVAIPAISKGKGDDSVFDVEDAIVGDGDPMGIAAEVVEDFFGSAEWRLGVDDPWLFIKLSDQAVESGVSLERSGLARKNQLAAGKVLTEEVDILAAEYGGESFDGKEEIVRGRNPAVAIVGQDAGGDEAVEMEMGLELLVPGVEHGDHPGLSAEVVVAEGKKGLSGGIEKDF